ncbi:MAG: hypothetical protein U0528_20685 [Anaerolineae bacterium]
MTLPVRELVLYKHGVGFFVRQGQINGTQFGVTFRRDEVNDILKSLIVFDQAGGQVLGIDYQTPMDREVRLANSSIRLSETNSVRDLIRRLRGRRVEITTLKAGNAAAFSGRMIGLDELITDEASQSTTAVQLDNGQVQIVALSDITGIKILDSPAESDLSYFLDTSLIEDSRRTVNVRLSEGDHDIVIYYVAPSPTWRVSYRLVAESDANQQTGKAVLQGWGLFDNRLEEDLDQVKVTLVAGQPISFIYDLYTSQIPARPTVRDEARVAPGPVEYAEAAAAEELMDAMPRERAFGGASRATANRFMAASAPMAAAAPPRPKLADVAQSTATSTETKDAAEFFQYAITTPVTVKRGDSALVPITNSQIKYSRELLYNGAKLPNHPVAALRFSNSTGLTLERGPITVVEDGDYKGEAIVAFTKDNGEVYLPYAVELGVKVTEHSNTSEQTVKFSISGSYLRHDLHRIETTTYILENTTTRPLVVTIEASGKPNWTQWELFDTRKPDAENANEQRWKVETEARKSATFTRKRRALVYKQEELINLNYQNLQRYLENKWLDRATFDQLTELLNTLGVIQRANEEIAKLNRDRTQVYEEQNQLRANITTLQTNDAEVGLRNRMLAQLTATQDRLDSIAARLSELEATIITAQKAVDSFIAGEHEST